MKLNKITYILKLFESIYFDKFILKKIIKIYKNIYKNNINKNLFIKK